MNFSEESHSITQEIIFLSVSESVLYFRVDTFPLPPYISPDANLLIYLSMMGWEQFPERLIHSTSWRFEEEAGLILTWVVVPDPTPDFDSPIMMGGILYGESCAPVPSGLDIHAVARHAARHVAFLLHTDKAVGFALHHYPELHDALISLNPDVAGNPHIEVLPVGVRQE